MFFKHCQFVYFIPTRSKNKPIINSMYLFSSQAFLKVKLSYTYNLGFGKIKLGIPFFKSSLAQTFLFKKVFCSFLFLVVQNGKLKLV